MDELIPNRISNDTVDSLINYQYTTYPNYAKPNISNLDKKSANINQKTIRSVILRLLILKFYTKISVDCSTRQMNF
jgi:hypothetical protein